MRVTSAFITCHLTPVPKDGKMTQCSCGLPAKDMRIGMLETIKKKAGPLTGMLPSANMRDRARKIYDLAKELQDDLSK